MTSKPDAPPALSRPDLGGAQHTILDALLESRDLWRDLVQSSFDLIFETDAVGHFTLFGPDDALGWSADRLLGLSSETLLLSVGGVAGFNPFRAQLPVRRHRTWLRRADGRAACVLISAHPLHDDSGALIGARGAAEDITDQERRDERVADTLLRRQTIKEISRRMQRAVLPDMVIKIGLEELLDSIGAAGAVLVACDGVSPIPGALEASSRGLPRILHRAGAAPPLADAELVAYVAKAASPAAAPWTIAETRFDCRLILSATGTHFCEPVVLMIWRELSRGWITGDAELAAAFLATLGGVLEHDQVQRELARQSGADTLTGLLNRDSFKTEVKRRLDRLDTEGFAATLMIVGLDRFRDINEARGHESGDEVLRQSAQILRDAVRPTDLVARLSGDVFALWLDGADQFAAAERAEMMCQKGISIMLDEPVELKVSVGLATRPNRSYETIDSLIEQAHAALNAIKLAGGGRWHFYNEGTGA